MKKLAVFTFLVMSLFAFAVNITVFHINDTHAHASTFADSNGNRIGGF